MVLKKFYEKRRIPALPSFDKESWPTVREDLKSLLLKEEYGEPVPAPTELTFEESGLIDPRFCAGLGMQYQVKVHSVVCGKPFDFSFVACIPSSDGPHPFFVFNNFYPGEPNKYFPAEEIIDRGFAVLHLNYKDITSDDDDFTTGLAACVYPDGGKNREGNATGKLAMWAWANMRVLDYAMTCPFLDHDNAAVIGHSRLGKTALLTGMLDERFRYVAVNGAGNSGDALSRGNEGERVRDITAAFPFWFAPNYLKYADRETMRAMPFDQHMALATIAPRTLMIGTAYGDVWASPESQVLSCAAASRAWEQLGLDGYVAADRMPEIGERFDEGNVCLQYRPGVHFLSRLDWNFYMDCIEKKMAKK